MSTFRIYEHIRKHLSGHGNLKNDWGMGKHSAWLSISEWPGEKTAHAKFLKYCLNIALEQKNKIIVLKGLSDRKERK